MSGACSMPRQFQRPCYERGVAQHPWCSAAETSSITQSAARRRLQAHHLMGRQDGMRQLRPSCKVSQRGTAQYQVSPSHSPE